MKRLTVIGNESSCFIPHSWFMKNPQDGTKNIIHLYERGLINIGESVRALCSRLSYEDWSEITPESFSPRLYGSQFNDMSFYYGYYWVRENFDFTEDRSLGVEFASRELFIEFSETFPMKEKPLCNTNQFCGNVPWRVTLSLTFKERFALSRLKEDYGWELVTNCE